MSDGQKSHFVNFWNSTTHSPFESRSGGGTSSKQRKTAQSHGKHLKKQYTTSWSIFESQKQSQAKDFNMNPGDGIILNFESSDDVLLNLKSLNLISKGIELRSVKMDGRKQIASVFIPDASREHFLKNINKFIEANKNEGTGLFYMVEQIQSGTIEELWTEPFNLPDDKNDKFLWEIWLAKNNKHSGVTRLKEFCQKNNLYFHDSVVHFGDRTVLLVAASVSEMEASIFLIPELSELREASQINADFISMQNSDTKEFMDDLLLRIKPKKSNILVSLFDTGVKTQHALIEPFIIDEHIKAVDTDWCNRDLANHGTLMAGISLYGDITPVLSGDFEIEVNHSIESVKVFNKHSAEPQFIPSITQTAFDLTADDDYKRVYVMSLTQNEFNFGMPTSQSVIIDQNTFGVNGNSRLMIIPTGNRQEINGEIDLDYLSSVDDYQIQEPAQSWNALTVGGYTELSSVSDPIFKNADILAPRGELAPNSRVSTSWNEKKWPIKPDIVMESGNYISINGEVNSIDDLSLLSTSGRLDTHLESINGTSVASAQVAKFCAEIMVQFPELRAETIKGLVVHTSDWTRPMLDKYKLDSRKAAMEKVLRTYGYGVPNLQRALYSASNSVTLILEDIIIPYAANEKNQGQKINEWNIHDLPWPKELLEKMGAANVKVTVTLCYFIEPHASRRGFMSRYQYSSHGLRFEMKAPGESPEDFRIRVNKKEVDGAKSQSTGDGSNWLMGPTIRSHTTCQKDVWEGSAVDLADKNQIGIYPVGGWWKEQGIKDRNKGLWGTQTHYSLIVSIASEDQNVDLYSEIENIVDIGTDVVIRQGVTVDA